MDLNDMDLIDSDLTLASLVTQRPELASHLDALGLDFCCGGQRRLVDAVDEGGLDLAETVATLQAVPVGAAGSSDSDADNWNTLGMVELVDHLEATHHAYLRDALVRMDPVAEKVAGVHGERHPELAEVLATFRALRADLEPHLMKEEQVLFPMIRALADATEVADFHCGTLGNPIAVMSSEHDRVGELLARLRSLTDAYTVPDDGCASYQLLYTGLAELEADTHLHVHKENNLLFPRAIEAERRLAG
jgi:regulator of cell morphogenesis and NO signaling